MPTTKADRQAPRRRAGSSSSEARRRPTWRDVWQTVGQAAHDFAAYVRQHRTTLYVLVAIAIAAYGFELFQLNLTIDEEIHAFRFRPEAWVSQGRWGMYLLSRFLLPYPVIPFVPLALALGFHIAAAMLMMYAWRLQSMWETLAVGALFVAYPGVASIYTFSTINFGVGIGFFLVALSLVATRVLPGNWKLLAAIPAGLSLAIYQAFLVVLGCGFAVTLAQDWLAERARSSALGMLLRVLGILTLAAGGYFLIQKGVELVTVRASGYVDQLFDLDFLIQNTRYVTRNVGTMALRVYLGDQTIYVADMGFLGWAVAAAGMGFAFRLRQSTAARGRRVGAGLLAIAVLALPFVPGLLTRGFLAMRFLIALPVALGGITVLGIGAYSRRFLLIPILLVAATVFQSVVSTNRLFASSHLALQADRLFASRLLQEIDRAKDAAGVTQVEYLEVVGFWARPTTPLVPKLETFGASFFEWDQGSAGRVIFFLRTLEFQDLDALPEARRGEVVPVALSMPVWPAEGSVRIAGDTVIVKLGPYSDRQIRLICAPDPAAEICGG